VVGQVSRWALPPDRHNDFTLPGAEHAFGTPMLQVCPLINPILLLVLIRRTFLDKKTRPLSVLICLPPSAALLKPLRLFIRSNNTVCVDLGEGVAAPTHQDPDATCISAMMTVPSATSCHHRENV
jgi:hypothetical protein